MGKNPAFQFYIKDWLSDPQLKMVSFQTKGLWVDFLCYLWESPDRGTLSAAPEKFCQMLGCSQAEWDQFYTEASVTKFADVTNRNGIVTITNRRMYREEKERKNTRLRVERFRQKQVCNATSNDSVMALSPSPSPYPSPIKNFFVEGSSELRLASLLLQKIRERKPDYKQPDIQRWAKDVDRMIRIDRRAPEQIERVILWCQGDGFWQNNILSTDKLRKKFDQLELKMNSPETGRPRPGEYGWV